MLANRSLKAQRDHGVQAITTNPKPNTSQVLPHLDLSTQYPHFNGHADPDYLALCSDKSAMDQNTGKGKPFMQKAG